MLSAGPSKKRKFTEEVSSSPTKRLSTDYRHSSRALSYFDGAAPGHSSFETCYSAHAFHMFSEQTNARCSAGDTVDHLDAGYDDLKDGYTSDDFSRHDRYYGTSENSRDEGTAFN